MAQQILDESRTEQPRDPDTGQFQSPNDQLQRFSSSPTTEQVEEPQPFVPAEEPQQTEEPAAEPVLLAGRFPDTPEGREQLARSYQELEQQQGRSSAEVNDLRTRVEQLSQRVYQEPAPQPVLQPELNADQIDAGLDRRGVEFLAELYEAEHPSYDAALDRMFEVAPRLAGDWQSRVAAWEAQQELRAELQPALASVAGPVTRSETQGRWNSAWRELAGDNPEMAALSAVMLQDLEENQHLTLPIKEGLPNAERIVIENLLIRARDANRDKLQEARTQQDQQVHQEKMDAHVATQGAGAVRTSTGTEIEEGVKKLKSSILAHTQGQNVHEAIHGSRGAS